MATLDVIVLNWNGFDDTCECVDALLTSTFGDFLLHLVDNGSAADEGARLAERYRAEPRVRVLPFPENLGFARGVNQALEPLLGQDDAGYVMLLNNDAVVEVCCLERLTAAAEATGAQIVATRMVRYDQPGTLDNAGHLWLNTGEILPRGAGEPADDYGAEATLVGACAGAALYDKDLLRRIGTFDPYFHTGYEDAELGLRAFLAGAPTHYCPTAVVRHKVSRSLDKVRDFDYSVNIQRNINYTIIKLTPAGLLLLNAPFMAVKTLLVPLTALLFLRTTLFRAHVLAIVRTARDLPRALAARRRCRFLRRHAFGRGLRAQRFFLPVYLGYFRAYLLTGRPTVFER